jgi:hypothetical protein
MRKQSHQTFCFKQLKQQTIVLNGANQQFCSFPGHPGSKFRCTVVTAKPTSSHRAPKWAAEPQSVRKLAGNDLLTANTQAIVDNNQIACHAEAVSPEPHSEADKLHQG